MDFNRLSQNVGSNIQKMSSHISDIERMVRQIGTPAESADSRDRLHTLTHNVHNVAKETGELLKTMSNLPAPFIQTEQRQQKLLKEKLFNQFTEALERFQRAQRQAAQKEREGVVKARAQSQSANNQSNWNPFEDDGSRTAGASALSAQTQLQMEEDMSLQVLQEREDSIRKLESDIQDVNQIFKDLAVLVHEQGEMIDSIEANVEAAQVHVEQGTSQLSEARKYQAKSRRKMVCVIVILAVLALILGLVIYFSIPHT